jgi:hypothetical protein
MGFGVTKCANRGGIELLRIPELGSSERHFDSMKFEYSNIRCQVIALHRLVESNQRFNLKYSNL